MEKTITTMGNSMEVPKKLKIQPPYNSAVACLGIYQKEMKTL